MEILSKADLLATMIKAKLPDAIVDVRDMTGGGDHWELNVKSKAFHGISLIEQHRLIHQALGNALEGAIHAVQIKTAAL